MKSKDVIIAIPIVLSEIAYTIRHSGDYRRSSKYAYLLSLIDDGPRDAGEGSVAVIAQRARKLRERVPAGRRVLIERRSDYGSFLARSEGRGNGSA